MGLLYLAGVFKSGRQNRRYLWAEDGTGIKILRLMMSLFRFKFLVRCIRFEDAEYYDNYSLGGYITIEGNLEAFRVRPGFRQYIPNKVSKYGIKKYVLVHERTYYISNIEIYVGNQPEGPYKLSNLSHDVVINMVAPISRSGRNVTTDNWFTRYPLAMSE
ncbi:hypothetical protein PR048_028529 [Dryococelus australis]|uniref:PiggyBac transposable element-derived protein domain-containing protein n=1 Tax=Dryococelus australis TaxID=614101 RepID=A0ABQ9GB90_9NEOP|nr:hypothetical protein PR048_028529 [Dryococelus australis]